MSVGMRAGVKTQFIDWQGPLGQVLMSCRWVLIAIAGFSGVVNILALTGSIFMMQVYDRVLASQSIPTLVMLSLMAVAAYTFQGLIDVLRTRVLTLVGEHLDQKIGPRLYAIVAEMPLRLARQTSETLQPLRDLDTVRAFLGGPGPVTLFDLPWLPLYLGLMFLMHAWLGWLTVIGAVILIMLTVITEIRSKRPTLEAVVAQSTRNMMADGTQRGAEVVKAMGMLPALAARWEKTHAEQMQAQRRATFTVSSLAGVAKTVRMVLQSAMLGLGAYLVIEGQLSAGMLIASNILSSRALAPIDQAIAVWRTFMNARQSYGRMSKLLAEVPEAPALFSMPRPYQSLHVENLAVAAPQSRNPLVKRATFKVKAGQAVGIIGQSASGKTTLARALVGIWPPLAGKVMLDSTSIDQWSSADLGPALGYLPQDVQLFDGTIAENIARFVEHAPPDMVIAAAKAAGIHEHISAFPDAYNTKIGHGGGHLSAGQRQRVGLARALYGDPFLVVLDEPNANLDSDGEVAVLEAIRSVRERGGIVIVIAHRASALRAVDLVAVMNEGVMTAFGPRDEVLAKTTQATQPKPNQAPVNSPIPAGKSGGNNARQSLPNPGVVRTPAPQELVLTGASGGPLSFKSNTRGPGSRDA
jgi:PrtD family type I secretion system ABC transporter